MIYDFSTRLRKLRLEKHLKQEQVALLVGVTKSAVSSWEQDTRQPSYQVLLRLADVFNVTTDYLLGRENSRVIDLSGLTASEAAAIGELVSSMTAKNKRLEVIAGKFF